MPDTFEKRKSFLSFVEKIAVAVGDAVFQPAKITQRHGPANRDFIELDGLGTQ
jgi:hypothetical protein